MIYLQASQKARTALGMGREDLGPAGPTQSVLGNWLLNVVPMGERTAMLFMSSRTLLSFPILIGKHTPTLEDMQAFLSHGIALLMEHMRQDSSRTASLVQDLSEIRICKIIDKSLQAVFTAVAADYAHRVRLRGGLATDNLGEIIARINSTPRATLSWRTSFEASLALLHPDRVQPIQDLRLSTFEQPLITRFTHPSKKP